MNNSKKIRESIIKFKNWGEINNTNKANFIIIAFGLLIFIALSIAIPEFFKIQNIINLIVQISTLGFLAIGVTYVLITGGIDLSLVTVMTAASVVGAKVMVITGSPFLGCLMMVVVGCIFGIINGFAVAKAKMIPFIVTLSTMYLALGFGVWFTNANSITGFPKAFTSTIGGEVGNFPVSAIIIIILAIITGVILSKTKYGR
jgi:ribose/xylose/arabinose/galactoside ABC-type transport system permease subunit